MKFLYLLILLSSSLFYTTKTNAEEVSAKYVLDSIKKAALTVGIEPALLWSVCYSESAHVPSAYVHDDGLKNNSAFGVCQVLYTTALDFGMKPDPGCLKDYRQTERVFSDISEYMITEKAGALNRSYENCKLFGAYTNALYAAKYLKYQIDKHNGSWISGIAAYNTGSLKVCKDGKVYRAKDKKVLYRCEKNGLLNQKYVDRILDGMRKYPYKGELHE